MLALENESSYSPHPAPFMTSQLTTTDRFMASPQKRVWVITTGEPLPTDGQGDRLLRSAMLCETLANQGHEVLWWTSDFDHVRKCHRTGSNSRFEVDANLKIQTLASIGYRRNLSVRRIFDHAGVAKQFRKMVVGEPKPDVILSSLPTLELCEEANAYGQKHQIPVALDIRDLWPDLFLDCVPSGLKWAGKMALQPMFRSIQRICSQATAICGITEPFVQWGLDYAGRPKTALDKTFAMAYRDRAPSPDERRKAEEFWDSLGIDDSKFVLCFFGVIGRHSEIETVVRAARNLEQSCPDLRVVLCGLGPNLERCRALAEGSSVIQFPGWIHAAQIWTLLRRSQVGLAPFINCDNYTKNLPNKPIEYLSAGLPIITSIQGLLSEILTANRCGWTYPQGDTQALARLMEQLYRDRKALEPMRERSLALYRDNYRAEEVYHQMANHLIELSEINHSHVQKSLAVA